MLNGETKRDMSQGVLLIVDDEVGVRQSLQLVFNRTYRVFEATSADEAIEKLTAERPDVVLLDIVMPGRGPELLCKEELKTAYLGL